MEKKVTLTDYFLSAKKFEGMKRYATQHELLQQSNPEHSFMMLLMAQKLIDELNLDLNFKKVIKMITYHDFCELGFTSDYEAAKVNADPNLRLEKELLEDNNIKKVARELGDPELLDIYNEYNAGETSEAKFVKALDKLESAIHKISRGIDYCTHDAEFTATYPNKYVTNFPELIPFWEEFQQLMKKKFTEKEIEWKDEYHI